MSGDGLQPPQRGASAGCLRSLAGVAALAVLAPFALAIRSFRAWRRGAEIRIERTRTELDIADRGRLGRIDTAADVPAAALDGFRRRLTDTVVRVAEALRRSDDVYHLLFRDPPAAETVVLPIGPQLQELGERVFLVLGEGAMAGRTTVWLTLPRGRRVVELVDPFEYDPEGSGEPERLLVRSGMRWGMATAFDRRGPAVLYRVVLYVPIEAADRVGAVLDRLSR
jgi:hypothetical protein